MKSNHSDSARLVGCVLSLLACALLTSTEVTGADVDGLDLELHPGPEVWFEEHWQVKPEKLQAFVQAYKNEVYAVARHTPGYRGYSFWTFLQPVSGEPPVPTLFTPGASRDEFIQPHPSIRLNGEILTERVINIGSLMARTYNVLIVHHLQSWSDGASFHQAMADLYARNHPGEDLWEHLSKSVYPLVDNVWTAYFRVINTGYPSEAYPAPKMADDADGLNLEPRPGPVSIIEEGWDVRPGKLDEFVEVYKRDVYSWLRQVPGYRGLTTMTYLPPAARDLAPAIELGGSDEFIVPYPGMLLDGTVRTDHSINAGALFKQTYNVKVMHYIETWEDQADWLSNLLKIYAAANDGDSPWKLFEQTLFPLVNNHWDFPYRAIETSYVADSEAVH